MIYFYRGGVSKDTSVFKPRSFLITTGSKEPKHQGCTHRRRNLPTPPSSFVLADLRQPPAKELSIFARPLNCAKLRFDPAKSPLWRLPPFRQPPYPSSRVAARISASGLADVRREIGRQIAGRNICIFHGEILPRVGRIGFLAGRPPVARNSPPRRAPTPRAFGALPRVICRFYNFICNLNAAAISRDVSGLAVVIV